jgi:membrane protease YdiL (CAAX protease family)
MDDEQTLPAVDAGPSPISFGRGLGPLVALLVATTVVAALFPLYVYPRLDGPVALAAMALAFTILAGMTWATLRYEGVSAASVGLGRADVLPGLLAVGGLYLLANGFAAASTYLATGSVEFVVPEGVSASAWVAMALVQLLFVGPTEEFAFRAYVQNKLVAAVGGGADRARKAVGILLGVVLFALWHVPQRVFAQGITDLGSIVGTLVVVAVLGTLLGLLYEYTRNVVLGGLLHGTFNWSFLFVADASLDRAFLLALPAFGVGLWYYRRWARDRGIPGFGPQVQGRPAH